MECRWCVDSLKGYGCEYPQWDEYPLHVHPPHPHVPPPPSPPPPPLAPCTPRPSHGNTAPHPRRSPASCPTRAAPSPADSPGPPPRPTTAPASPRAAASAAARSRPAPHGRPPHPCAAATGRRNASGSAWPHASCGAARPCRAPARGIAAGRSLAGEVSASLRRSLSTDSLASRQSASHTSNCVASACTASRPLCADRVALTFSFFRSPSFSSVCVPASNQAYPHDPRHLTDDTRRKQPHGGR